MYLYYIDIKYHDSVLNRVDKGENLQDLMTSPVPGSNRKSLLKESMGKSRDRASLVNYKLDSSSRN